MENTPITGHDATKWQEHMKEKHLWFRKMRGDISNEEFAEKLRLAIGHAKGLAAAHLRRKDPGGSALGKSAALVSKLKGLLCTEVTLPQASDSDNFVTSAFHVHLGPTANKSTEGNVGFAENDGLETYFDAAIKLRPKRGASRRWKLETARVFLFNAKFGTWNLVENSGFNEEKGYIYAEAYRDGIYAAIALPSNPKQLREIALTQFAFSAMQMGIEAGVMARRADFFEGAGLQQLATLLAEERLPAKDRADFIRVATALQKETTAFRKRMPMQFLGGSSPEWQILSDIQAIEPDRLRLLGIDDILGNIPFFFRLSNKVSRWHRMGPMNINGRVKTLAIHPTNGEILYAGAANGGIWKTTTGGSHWTHLWKFEETMAIGAMAIAPSEPNTIYVATGEYTPNYGPSFPGIGLFKSTNGGSHWTNVAGVAKLSPYCSGMAVHPTDADILYISTSDGVYKSTNGGSDFNRVLTGACSDVILDPNAPETLYAGRRNDGVYKSIDGGGIWNLISGTTKIFFLSFTMPVGNNAGWIKLAMGRNGAGGTQCLLAKMGQRGEHLMQTFDGFTSWISRGTVQPVDYNEWCTLVAIHPQDESWLYAGGVWMSCTEGNIGFTAATGYHADVHKIVFHPIQSDTLFLACDGGVYRSTDRGKTWHLQSYGLVATQLQSLGVADNGTFVAGCATQDQGIIQTEGSYDWNDFGGGNEWGMFVVDPNSSENIYISPGGGQLRRSTDRGRNYTTLTTGLTDWWASQNRNTAAAAFSDMAVQPDDSNILVGVARIRDEVRNANDVVTASYTSDPRIYRSSNQGDNWGVAFTLPQPGTSVAFAPSDSNWVYVATDGGLVFRSTDAGLSGWAEPCTLANRPPAGVITSITVDHFNKRIVYITYGAVNPPVYRSSNGGQTWTPLGGSDPALRLPNIPATSLVIDHEENDILYVGTDIGVFRSNDAGQTWYYYNDSDLEFDLPRVKVSAIKMHKATNRLFAATMGRGLYYTHTSGIQRLQVIEVCKVWHGVLHQGIKFLKVKNGSTVSVMSRTEVIHRIQAGTYVYVQGTDGSRAEVLVMQPDDAHPQEYLKTRADGTLLDNLLSLPRFFM
jgi:photosystem II stability/assembly factor-like uncharacterized protein